MLDQSEKVGRNDKVNITINMNGQKSNFDSFNELFSNSQVMSQVIASHQRSFMTRMNSKYNKLKHDVVPKTNKHV